MSESMLYFHVTQSLLFQLNFSLIDQNSLWRMSQFQKIIDYDSEEEKSVKFILLDN